MTAAFPLKWPDGWKRTVAISRKNSGRFGVTYDKAVEDLYENLRALGAKSVVVSSHLQVNQRGQVLSGNSRHQLPDPGVAVYFVRGIGGAAKNERYV